MQLQVTFLGFLLNLLLHVEAELIAPCWEFPGPQSLRIAKLILVLCAEYVSNSRVKSCASVFLTNRRLKLIQRPSFGNSRKLVTATALLCL